MKAEKRASKKGKTTTQNQQTPYVHTPPSNRREDLAFILAKRKKNKQ
jgi:hypothetical protein